MASSRSIEGVEAFTNIEVEPSVDRLVLRRHRVHDLAAERHLVQRRHALLTIEQQRLGLPRLDALERTLDRPRLEIDRTTRL